MSPLPRSSAHSPLTLGVFLPAKTELGRLTPSGGPLSSTSSSGRASVDALWSPIKDVLHRVFSNDTPPPSMEDSIEAVSSSPVVFCDDLCLSPLAPPHTFAEGGDLLNKTALERSMSREVAVMDEWRCTSHVRMPGPSPLSSCSPPKRSPLPFARSPAPGGAATPGIQRTLSREWDRARSWLHKGAPELPLPDLHPSGGKQLQFSMDDLGASECSIKEEELPSEMPIEQEELDRIQRKHGEMRGGPAVSNMSDDDDDDDEDSDNEVGHFSSAAAAARATGAEGESMWERVFKAGRFVNKVGAGAMEKRRRPAPGDGEHRREREPPRYDAHGKKLKKRRVVKKDPNKPKPKPWSETELEHFRHLLATEGPTDWGGKAEKLGTGRTAKSLHTRWLRDEGRIVDRPRGMAAMREQAQAAAAAKAAAANN